MTTVAEPNDDAALPAARPRHLIVTVYGLYGRADQTPPDHHPADRGWLSIASLIRLLADLGVDEPAVRSAISRLKRRGILAAQRHDAQAGYELSAEAEAILREGDARIFRRERATFADGWLLAVFSVPESERHRRHVLRSELTRLGFGMAAPGVWIVPAHPADATADVLRRLGLDAYADLFRANHVAFGDLTVKVREWWDLDELQRQYERFLQANEPALNRWALLSRGVETNPPDPPPATLPAVPGDPQGSLTLAAQAHAEVDRAAFTDYMRALTDWRRLPYLDPGLPTELLPDDWIGIRAADVFFALRSRLADPAHAHVRRVVGG